MIIKNPKQYTILFDVDGVLTTGQFLYDENGKKFKIFGAHDSDGMKILKRLGFKIKFITSDRRGLYITKARLRDMGFDIYYSENEADAGDFEYKDESYEYGELVCIPESGRKSFIENTFNLKKLIYVADGYYDAPIMRECFYSFAPYNARIEAKHAASWVVVAKGGEGAVLDIALYMRSHVTKK